MDLYMYARNTTPNGVDWLGLVPNQSPTILIDFTDLYHDYADVSIGFDPGQGEKRCPCKRVRFVQIVNNFEFTLWKSLLNPINWQIDWIPGGAGFPFYPFQENYRGGAATMQDSPGYRPRHLSFLGGVQVFETCVICVDKPSQPYIIGCASWGQYSGGLSPQEVFGEGIQFLAQPSAEFQSLWSNPVFPP